MNTRNEHSFTLTTKAAALWRFASKDDSRHNLTHVAITKHNGKVVAAATCGHRLGVVPVFGVELADEETILIPASLCQQIEKSKQEASLSVGENTILAQFANMEIHESRGDAAFPDINQVIPNGNNGNEPNTQPIGVNPQYIADVASWLKKAVPGTKNHGILLHVGMMADELSPIKITADELTYVVMPMRV